MQQKIVDLLIYGAYGYTGELIVEEALANGFQPVLAGRNAEKLKEIATAKNLPMRCFDLDDAEIIETNIADVRLVIHAAGPFVHTAKKMAKACVAQACHYLDITGEIQVFEGLQKLDQAAQEAGIMLMPGAGFDVVPSDCLAYYLKEQLPTATHLELAFTGVGAGPSQGTMLTAIENLGQKGVIRENGQLKMVPQAYKSKKIDFGKVKHLVVSIPWGDISTAWRSTGIPNIIVYMGMPPKMYKMLKWSNYLGWLLKQEWIKARFRKKVKAGAAGPSKEQRLQAKSYLWGQVKDEKGNQSEALLEVPEGYTLTAKTAVLIARKTLNENNYKLGFQTPATAYGAGLILEIPNTNRS